MEQDSKTTATASAAHLLQPESKSKGKGPALVALGLVCFLWGTTWIASRQGVKYMPALQLAAIRQVLGGLCYIVFYVIKGAPWPRGRGSGA